VSENDTWERIGALTATLTHDELLALAPTELARRLYWQEDLEHFAPVTPRFECTCSRQRSGRMLISLGREEVESILDEQGAVEITCDFCSARYSFDVIDVGQLFATGNAQAVRQVRH
jgi:molecular chaperone Hsp33